MGTRTYVGAALLAGVVLVALAGRPVVAEEALGEAAEWAISVWGRNCQKCHAVPDTRFETDRAFLGQIMETT